MGTEIAKCLTGPVIRKDGYLETKDGIVTWGFGHILRQAEPEEYDVKYKRWRMEDLPIIPQTWRLLVSESCVKQFGIVKGLIAKADEIVHAGDPDREGQLLIDEVLDYVENTKPVKRILLNALDEKSIKKAIHGLRENSEFLNLKQSALARARADWLIGMNLSRAYTLAAQRAGHKMVLPIGRVKTPTLALVVRRERELENFMPVDYFVIKAKFSHVNGEITTTWKATDAQTGLDSEGRLIDETVAKALLEKFQQEKVQLGTVTLYETNEKKESQRLPFSLSALQVLAGKRFGFEPQLVLDTAQKLYEKKLTTYPRSDCDYLPENQFEDAKVILANLANLAQSQIAAWAGQADATIKSRAWNDKKISAHHAIIPTQERCNFASLSDPEQKLYGLIAQAYLAQFYPQHVYLQTKVEICYLEERFTASGKVIKVLGWKELYRAAEAEEKKEEDADLLPAMQKADAVAFVEGVLDKKATRPPARFTAATLLAGMKEIHKYVKNPEAKKKLKDVYGIGTEATRATIIKELISRGFLQNEPKKKTLVPTRAAYLLVDALPDEMTYPDSTAVWESNLHMMAAGDTELTCFIDEQVEFTKELCEKAKKMAMPIQEGEKKCPRCNQGVLQLRNGKNGAFWGCSNYPNCRATYEDDNGKLKKPDHLCPRCKQGDLRLRNGKNGAFWGCSNYPSCRATYNDDKGKPDFENR